MDPDASRSDGTQVELRTLDQAGVLLSDALRALAEVERLIQAAQRATVDVTAPQLASHQAAIIDASREEAAELVAAAQADAARILEHATSGRWAADGDRQGAASHALASVIDLREPAPASPVRPWGPQHAADDRSELHDNELTSRDGSGVGPSNGERLAAIDDDLREVFWAASETAREVSTRVDHPSGDGPEPPTR